MLRDLDGKVAVVTGAASGIGRAMAERFAAEKMRVVLADVEANELEKVQAELQIANAKIVAVPTDVSRPEDVERLARITLRCFGAVHVVCNNAGVTSPPKRLWEAPQSDWDWVFGVNLWGVVHGIRAFVPILLEQKTEAHVVNTASMAGLLSAPLGGIYHATKHAVVSLSETLHHELRMTGAPIGVSVVCPGWVDTRIGDAERNRPRMFRNKPPAQPAPEWQGFEQAIRKRLARGLSPHAVASRVVEAIRSDRFWVLTHPDWTGAVRMRIEDILEGRNPGFTASPGDPDRKPPAESFVPRTSRSGGRTASGESEA